MLYYQIDVEDPTISNVPGNLIIDTTSNEAEATWIEPSASDNSRIYTLSSDYESGSLFQLGLTPVTYTAIDPSGNTATATFMINIQGRLQTNICLHC